MKIAIDIRELRVARTGIKTYIEELIRVFPKVAPQHEFVLLDSSTNPRSHSSAFNKIINHLKYFYWKEIELPQKARKAGCDVIFCADYVVPLPIFFSGLRVPVFHDSSFWENPQHYNLFWRMLMNLFAIPAAKKATVVITTSEFAKGQISKHLGIKHSKLVPIPEGAKESLRHPLLSQRTNEILVKCGIIAKTPYILHVGVLEKRKNLPVLITAFANIIERVDANCRLVLVGQPGPRANLDDSTNIEETIAARGLEGRVILTGYVTDEELQAFYQGATVYAFPSKREGFGLPILEAFANDLPVVASTAGSLPEVLGDAGLQFDPDHIEQLEKHLINLINDNTLRENLIIKGRNRLRKFSWRITADRIIDEIEKFY